MNPRCRSSGSLRRIRGPGAAAEDPGPRTVITGRRGRPTCPRCRMPPTRHRTTRPARGRGLRAASHARRARAWPPRPPTARRRRHVHGAAHLLFDGGHEPIGVGELLRRRPAISLPSSACWSRQEEGFQRLAVASVQTENGTGSSPFEHLDRRGRGLRPAATAGSTGATRLRFFMSCCSRVSEVGRRAASSDDGERCQADRCHPARSRP